MHILPAIDLFGGNAVRLHQGRYTDVTVYSRDPPAIAREWRGKVPVLHVVDLEGARDGRAVQRELVRDVIVAFGGNVQVGGGARTADAVESYFELGAARVILGTAAVRDPDLVRRAAERHPGRIVVALDARDGKVAVEGWEQTSTLTAIQVADSLAGAPIVALLYTDVSRDGTQVGPNLVATAALAARRRSRSSLREAWERWRTFGSWRSFPMWRARLLAARSTSVPSRSTTPSSRLPLLHVASHPKRASGRRLV